jgi:NADPH:quinone reductase-like Zn-dependent oxidoreductase
VKAAVLTELGQPPRFADFREPRAAGDQVVVAVTAAGVNHVDLAKASGSFYTGPPPLPSVVGSDGVGHTPEGQRVYFDACVPPFGAWAERTLVRRADLLEPDDGLDDLTAAALGNAGLAAWLGLSWRARLQPGESVLVLGANGALGSIAVQAAKVLGAGRVVAADRDADRLARQRERGADATVALSPGTDLAASFREAAGGGVDVIIDPLWGAPALAAMQAAAHGARHVQLGQLAGLTVDLPAPTVRSAALDIRGMAVFHAPLEVRRRAYRDLTGHASRGAITVDLAPVPLTDVATAWERQRGGPGVKQVLTP